MSEYFCFLIRLGCIALHLILFLRCLLVSWHRIPSSVMYTWENSPSCKQAIAAFETIGAVPKIVRLDDPWDEGNPIRATLGRKVGRTSVPFVFVGGQYIGGYDGGLEGNPDAGGMVDLAFRGKLREMLTEAGALN